MRGSVPLLDWIREHMCPNLGQPGATWNDTRVLIFTEYDDTKRYLKQQLEAAIAEHRPGRTPDRGLPRPDAAGTTGRDQAGVQRRPQQTPGPHPDRHRRRPRRPQPAGPLLEPVPLRRALEPQPAGAAQRPHRPQAPAQTRGLLPLLRLHASGPRTASSRCWCARPRRSSGNSAACRR